MRSPWSQSRSASAITRTRCRLPPLESNSSTLRARSSPGPARPPPPCRGRRQSCATGLAVAQPHRWGPDDPYLYSCRVTLSDGDDTLDVETTTFGMRTLSLDAVRGLRVNGEPILLRGACVHHDNGPLGACHDRPSRGAPDRDLEGGRVQCHQERPQSREQGHAECLRSTRCTRHGRVLRHVDGAQERVRLRPALPRLVGSRHRGHGAQGLQPSRA